MLEAADAIGTATSSRNSEVIHAGIYAAGSLKAKFCVEASPALSLLRRTRRTRIGVAASCW